MVEHDPAPITSSPQISLQVGKGSGTGPRRSLCIELTGTCYSASAVTRSPGKTIIAFGHGRQGLFVDLLERFLDR
jgi:hypothetical protein